MDELDTYLEKAVVVDTATSFIYLGVLKQVGEHFVTLADVDVHDCNDGSRTKEIYVLEAKRFGIRQNRTEVERASRGRRYGPRCRRPRSAWWRAGPYLRRAERSSPPVGPPR